MRCSYGHFWQVRLTAWKAMLQLDKNDQKVVQDALVLLPIDPERSLVHRLGRCLAEPISCLNTTSQMDLADALWALLKCVKQPSLSLTDISSCATAHDAVLRVALVEAYSSAWGLGTPACYSETRESRQSSVVLQQLQALTPALGPSELERGKRREVRSNAIPSTDIRYSSPKESQVRRKVRDFSLVYN
jgi:hypothetical protein